MQASRLPRVVAALFLAGDGFLGYRCAECVFVATGRTPEAVDAGITEHQNYRHGEDPLALAAAIGDVNA